MSIEIEKICRTCLGLAGPLLSIYDSGGNSSATGCIADMLSDFTKIKPRKSDNLPENVCLTCISEINRCYSFKLKCENSNRTLRHMLPDAVPEEVDEPRRLPAVSVIDREVQTLAAEKPQVKPLLVSQLVQTDLQTSEVATSPFVTRHIGKQLPDGQMILQERTTMKMQHLHEVHPESELILELLEEEDTNQHSTVPESCQEAAGRDAEDHTSYYELSDSQMALNGEDDAEESDSQNKFAYEEVKLSLSKQQKLDNRQKANDFQPLVYNSSTTDGKGKEFDYNFTVFFDNSNGETKVVPNDSQPRGKVKVDIKCPNCDSVFVSAKNLRRHLVKKHDWGMQQAQKHEVAARRMQNMYMQKRSDSKDTLLVELKNDEEEEDEPEERLEEETPKGDDATIDEVQEEVEGEEAVVAEIKEYIKPHDELEQTEEAADETDIVKLNFFCSRCDAGFALNKSLQYHLKLNVCTAPSYQCDECDRVFITQNNLDEHKQTHVYSHTCNECNMGFTTVEHLTQHMVSDHKRNLRNQCSICKKVFTMLSTLKDHMRIHSGEKPFVCPLCDRGFSQNANLKQHVMRHAKEKKYACDHCSSSFVTKAELRCHKRKHTGDAPYKCENCPSVFTTSSSLLKHKRKHTGERPYACDICPMRFASLNVLKNHRRTHTGEKPFECEICGKRFTQKGDCHIHQRTHTGEKTYGCYCGRKFMHFGSLRAHMKVHLNTEDMTTETVDVGAKERPKTSEKAKSSLQITIVGIKGEINEETVEEEVLEEMEQHVVDDGVMEQQVSQTSDDEEEFMEMNIEMC